MIIDSHSISEMIIEYFKGALYMKHVSLLFFVIIINACSTSSEVKTTSGKVEHSIYCSGGAYSWDTCYEKASVICGSKGYDILEKYEDQGAFIAYENSQVLPDRRLIIECKE